MRTLSRSSLTHLASSGFFGAALSIAVSGCAIQSGSEDTTENSSAVVITTNFADSTGRIDSVQKITVNGVTTTRAVDDQFATDIAGQRNPFFRSLGTNGRSCESCHKADNGWTITPGKMQAQFNATGGNNPAVTNLSGVDPAFRLNDGSNCPNLPVTTPAQRQSAFSLLLSKALIRIDLPIPANADYDVLLDLGSDRYGCGLVTDANGVKHVSVYRRPLPSTNVSALATVMWDGREGGFATASGNQAADLATLTGFLKTQANDATTGHAQGAPISDAQRTAIANFQLAMFTAQASDNVLGSLSANGATGGPSNLARQPVFIGINDPLGGNPTGAAFTSTIFTVIPDSWRSLTGSALANRQASVARGQRIFNTQPIAISGVRGVNDVLGVATVNGFCGTCHDSPNFGHHSLSLPLDLGIADAAVAGLQVGETYLPKFRVRSKATGQIIETTDPGRALISGTFNKTGAFKGPILRGLSSRAPFFHNGAASSLADVVTFYDTRFHLGFSAQQKADLQAFLETL
jgi:cytochrome c peroxidase